MSRIRCTKTSDFSRTYAFPTTYDVSSYSAAFSVGTPGNTLLSVTDTATLNGSSIVAVGNVVSLLLKAADLATLPDGDPITDPWVGIYQVRLTSLTGVTTTIDSDSFELRAGV